MKAKTKTAVLKGGVADPRLPGKVFFGPGAMRTGFILRKLREQVAESKARYAESKGKGDL